MSNHQVVSQDDWTRARLQLLQREKQLTRLRDELAAERRSTPWVEVTKQCRSIVFSFRSLKKSAFQYHCRPAGYTASNSFMITGLPAIGPQEARSPAHGGARIV